MNLNWLGDALFSTPFLRAIKENLPSSYLAVLGVLRIKEILETNPYLDQLILFDERGRDKGLFSRIRLIKKIKKKQFDTVFILKPSLSRTLMLKLTGIKEFIGFDNCKSGWLLTKRIPKPKKSMHLIDYFLTIPEHSGLTIKKRVYEFFPSVEDEGYVESLYSQNKIDFLLPSIIINPGANWIPKRWPKEFWSGLIAKIKESLNVNIIVTGAEKDKAMAAEIIERGKTPVFNLTGETTLRQLGALMKRARLVISADSGPMHIAASVGTKVIALFGPTSPSITGPYPLEQHIIIQKDVGCPIPCYNSDCRDFRCMKAISVEEVFRQVKQLILYD